MAKKNAKANRPIHKGRVQTPDDVAISAKLGQILLYGSDRTRNAAHKQLDFILDVGCRPVIRAVTRAIDAFCRAVEKDSKYRRPNTSQS